MLRELLRDKLLRGIVGHNEIHVVIVWRYADQNQNIVPKATGIEEIAEVFPLNHHTTCLDAKLCDSILYVGRRCYGKNIKNKQERCDRYDHNLVAKE